MTSYDVIFNRFMHKIKNDSDFLNYGTLSDTEAQELTTDHLNNLLNEAISEIYSTSNPDVNLNDKDDTLQQFNFDLVLLEVNLIADLMHQKYLEEDVVKLKAFERSFSSSELEMFSPAQERKTFLDMISNIKNNNQKSISNYISRDRKTGKLKQLGINYES